MITEHGDSPPSPLPVSSGRAITPAQPQANVDLPLLQPRAAWMREVNDRSDEQADVDWRSAVSNLLRSAVTRLLHCGPTAGALSFFDEEYVTSPSCSLPDFARC
jgi:hypothetical protein